MSNLKEYFQFSRRQRNGIFLLLFILVALLVAKHTVPYWVSTDEENAMKLFRENSAALKSSSEEGSDTTAQTTLLRQFNPNTISKDSLMLLGFNENLAQQIINYRTKIGPFTSKVDFSKLYNLPDSLYKIYEPYLLLSENAPAEIKPIELNSADSLQLIAIKGIGPFYAHKILEYRRKSGGYYSLDQLDEAFTAYGNTLAEKQQRMRDIKNQLQVNPSLIKKINITTATQKQLSQHPYINYRQSVAIIRVRDKKLATTLDELFEKSGFDSRMAKIVKHYLAWE